MEYSIFYNFFYNYMQSGLIPYKVLEEGQWYRLITYALTYTEPLQLYIECIWFVVLAFLFIKTYKFSRLLVLVAISLIGGGLLLLVCTEPYQATIGANSIILCLLVCLIVTYWQRSKGYVLMLSLMTIVELVVCSMPYTSWVLSVFGFALGIILGLLWKNSIKNEVP